MITEADLKRRVCTKRTQPQINRIAAHTRKLMGIEQELCPRVSRAISEFLAENLIEDRKINIELSSLDRHRFPAYYDAKNGILHIDKSIWEAAEIGDGTANFILAHELGHILLHTADHNLKFTASVGGQGYLPDREFDAEWQADTFAYCFLVPDHVAAKFYSAKEIQTNCGTNEQVAVERYNQAGKRRPLDLNRFKLRG